jgi:hypothetical protein
MLINRRKYLDNFAAWNFVTDQLLNAKEVGCKIPIFFTGTVPLEI